MADDLKLTDVPPRAKVVLAIQSSLSRNSSTSPAQRRPNYNWTGAIQSAASEVFERMLGAQLTCSSDPQPPQGEITAMVGLAGSLSGVLSIRCSFGTAALMASKMLGTITEDESATRDALGEICNITAGCFKSCVPGLEDTCFLSTPTIVMGHDFKVFSPANSETVDVHLGFDGASIWVALHIHQ